MKSLSRYFLSAEAVKCPEFDISSCQTDCELQDKTMKKGSTDDYGCLKCQCSQPDENIPVAKNGEQSSDSFM